jgi:hypothetical protein
MGCFLACFGSCKEGNRVGTTFNLMTTKCLFVCSQALIFTVWFGVLP